MSNSGLKQEPLDFLKSLWGSVGFTLPGMVTPTLDVEEIDKRIADMKAVENWMKVNLNMLQMTIQGLEMQRATLAAFQAISNPRPEAARTVPEPNPQAKPEAGLAMWPWNMMQQAAGMPQPAPEDSAPKPEDEQNKP